LQKLRNNREKIKLPKIMDNETNDIIEKKNLRDIKKTQKLV